MTDKQVEETSEDDKLHQAFTTISNHNREDWERLAHQLHSSGSRASAVINDAKYKYPSSLYMQCHYYLEAWLQNVGIDGAFEKLCQALTNCGWNAIRKEVEEKCSTIGNPSDIKTQSRKRKGDETEFFDLGHVASSTQPSEPKKDPCILILADEWGNPRNSFSVISQYLAVFLARVLGSHMKIISTAFNGTVKDEDGRVDILLPEEGIPYDKSIPWFTKLFMNYFLKNFFKMNRDLKYIIGHSPITAAAALETYECLRYIYPTMKVIIVNHCLPTEINIWLGNETHLINLGEKMLEWAKDADMVISVGNKVFGYFEAFESRKHHYLYIPISIKFFENKAENQGTPNSGVYAISCQPNLEVSEPVATAVKQLMKKELRGWNIYTKTSPVEETVGLRGRRYIAIHEKENDLESDSSKGHIYIDFNLSNPWWFIALHAICRCIPFCTEKDSHLAETMLGLKQLVDVYFVNHDDSEDWVKRVRELLDPSIDIRKKMYNIREKILLPHALLYNFKLITSLIDHFILAVKISIPKKDSAEEVFSEYITNRLSFCRLDEKQSACNLIFNKAIDPYQNVVLLAMEEPNSIRFALVASDRESLDKFYKMSQTPEFNTRMRDLLLSPTLLGTWMTDNELTPEDIYLTSFVEDEDFANYRKTLDSSASQVLIEKTELEELREEIKQGKAKCDIMQSQINELDDVEKKMDELYVLLSTVSFTEANRTSVMGDLTKKMQCMQNVLIKEEGLQVIGQPDGDKHQLDTEYRAVLGNINSDPSQDELEFQRGDIITYIEKVSDTHWKGKTIVKPGVAKLFRKKHTKLLLNVKQVSKDFVTQMGKIFAIKLKGTPIEVLMGYFSISKSLKDSVEVDDIDCEYWQLCKRFVQSMNINKFGKCVEKSHNVCYCSDCHSARGEKEVYTQGTPPVNYVLPVGWARFCLYISDRGNALESLDIWHRAYHGTNPDNVQAILETGDLLMSGNYTIDGKKMNIKDGHILPGTPGFDAIEVFVSPSIKYASHPYYAEPISYFDETTRITYDAQTAFQLLIKPNSYTIGCQTYDNIYGNEELKWSTRNRSALILCGLLIRLKEDLTISRN